MEEAKLKGRAQMQIKTQEKREKGEGIHKNREKRVLVAKRLGKSQQNVEGCKTTYGEVWDLIISELNGYLEGRSKTFHFDLGGGGGSNQGNTSC